MLFCCSFLGMLLGSPKGCHPKWGTAETAGLTHTARYLCRGPTVPHPATATCIPSQVLADGSGEEALERSQSWTQERDTRRLREQRTLSANPMEGRDRVLQSMLSPSLPQSFSRATSYRRHRKGNSGMETSSCQAFPLYSSRMSTPYGLWLPHISPCFAPSPSPGTCTIVSRFCRDVETELMTEEGPMVTTLMWWEGGGGAGTITVGWWVGAGAGSSCKTGTLHLFLKVLGASLSLLTLTEGTGWPSLCLLPWQSLCLHHPHPPCPELLHSQGPSQCVAHLSYFKKQGKGGVERGFQSSEIPGPLPSPPPSKHVNI